MEIDERLKELKENMQNATRNKREEKQLFQFKPFSRKQKQILTWWCDNSPVKDKDGIIADGAIRSGKTICMSLSFVLWAMTKFDAYNFGMCGKTIGSFRRNVLFWLKLMLRSRGYTVKDHRTDNLFVVSRNGTENYFYIFGGKDESSQDLIQGITLAGVFFDEVALMPESFVNQATARCSVQGSKFWFNCNPENPKHWFKVNWIDKINAKDKPKNIVYVHFTMDDNLSLAEETKTRYKNDYVGVFYKRYILGLWCVAEGSCYQQFAEKPEAYHTDKPDYDYIHIGVDIGGNKSGHTFVASGLKRNASKLTALASTKIKATGTTPEDIYNSFDNFLNMVYAKYGYVDTIFFESAEQILKNGITQRHPELNIVDSIKNEIIHRIRKMNELLAQKRFYYTDDAETVKDALSEAMWNPKKIKDERLDDGTTDIDTLDAFEYSWEVDIQYL